MVACHQSEGLPHPPFCLLVLDLLLEISGPVLGWMKFFYPDYVALDPKMGVAVHPLLYLTLGQLDGDRWTFEDTFPEGYPPLSDNLWDRRRPLTSQLETGFVQKWHEIDHYDWPERRFLETEEVTMVKEYQEFNWGNA